MKIKLIAPRKSHIRNPFNKEVFPPLGIMTLAAYTPENVEVGILDENVDELVIQDGLDLVGITTLTSTAYRAYEIADRYRELDTKVILGGIHASMVPEESLKHADAVVVGEAEAIWPQILSDAKGGNLKPFYTQEKPSDFERPLLPRRDLIDPDRYFFPNAIQTARGCPHDCSFCSVTAFSGRKCRTREIDNVLAELDSLFQRDSLREKGMVAIVDDNIAARPSRAKELFKALTPLNIIWGSQACITITEDEELLALAAESGCRYLAIGLETISSQALTEIGKHQNKVEKYEKGLRLFRKYGIFVMGSFIFGFDSDDASVFLRTLEFTKKNKLPFAQFSTLTPYPGTRLYKELLEGERVEPDYWLNPLWTNRVTFTPKRMSANQLHQNTNKVYRDFYSYPSILKRLPFQKLMNIWITANFLYRRMLKKRQAIAL